MEAKSEIWCDKDEHKLFEYFDDFNEWLDGDEARHLREQHNIDGLRQPSKAFYASDKEAYEQTLEEYRLARRHEVLNENYFLAQFRDNHWFQRNLDHFDQFVQCLMTANVVPFVGAGLSVDGGFPTWQDHLRQQGRTAGIDQDHISTLLSNGQYEAIIEEIENIRGSDVFIQEIRDVFSRPGDITYTTIRLAELFTDSVITTNYDRLIEQAIVATEDKEIEIISGMNLDKRPSGNKVTLYKLHGDIKNPSECILSKNQYDEGYGDDKLDLSRPIPSLLEYFYKNNSLLFLGCSLNNDRTVQVFNAIKEELKGKGIPQHFSIEQAPEHEEELVARNAYLAKLGMTAIWFEQDRFDHVESILRLARNELRYRGFMSGMHKFSFENIKKRIKKNSRSIRNPKHD